MQKFVIFCRGRSGSNLLCGILDQHPDIDCHYEIFHPTAIYMGRGREREDEESVNARDASPIQFIEDIYSETTSSEAMGFKLITSHNEQAVEHCLKAADIKKRILARENQLAQYSSQKIADETQQWVTAQASTAQQETIQFDQSEFTEFIQRNKEEFDGIESHLTETPPENILRIEYTQIASRRTVRKLYEFVGVPHLAIAFPKITKQNTSDILDRFTNPEETRNTLEEMDKLEWTQEKVQSWRESLAHKFITRLRLRIRRELLR